LHHWPRLALHGDLHVEPNCIACLHIITTTHHDDGDDGDDGSVKAEEAHNTSTSSQQAKPTSNHHTSAKQPHCMQAGRGIQVRNTRDRQA
jgi:hypothetical protein